MMSGENDSDLIDPDEEFPGRWIRVLCDSSCDGVWNIRGEACGPEYLPIPDLLKERLRAWQSWYERCENDYGLPEFEDVEAFSAEGLSIARAMKAAMPDWTVIYFDEAKASRNRGQKRPRTEYEYEVSSASE